VSVVMYAFIYAYIRWQSAAQLGCVVDASGLWFIVHGLGTCRGVLALPCPVLLLAPVLCAGMTS
jgi:hypothetical protein